MGKRAVTLNITLEEAERLSFGMSDLLCWASGFNAALGNDDLDRRPMGIEAVRAMNISLKQAIDRSQK